MIRKSPKEEIHLATSNSSEELLKTSTMYGTPGCHKRTSTTTTNNKILEAMNGDQLEEMAQLMSGNNRRMKSLD